MPNIMLPEGIEIPDGSVPGDEVEMLARVKLGEGGKAQLIALDGLAIKGYENGEEEGEEDEKEMEAKPAAGGEMGKKQAGFLETALNAVRGGGGGAGMM